MNHETLSPKKKFKMPHSYVIIFILLLLMCVLTYVIPSGTYARYEDEALGRTVVDPNNFTSTGSDMCGSLLLRGVESGTLQNYINL